MANMHDLGMSEKLNKPAIGIKLFHAVEQQFVCIILLTEIVSVQKSYRKQMFS